MATAELKKIEVTLTDGAPYAVPYWLVDSGEPGPSVLVFAAQHGNEVQGSEMLRRIRPTLEGGIRAGRCVLVPFANPKGVERHQPHVDAGPKKVFSNSLNSSWPGDPEGNNAKRLACALHETVVRDATHVLDLHCWQHLRATTGLARTDRPDTIELANLMGPPFGRHGLWKPEATERPVFPCTISNYFNDSGRFGLTVEFSGQYGFWHIELQRGGRMLRNAFRHFGMLPGEMEEPEHPTVWLNDCDQVEVRAPAEGVFVQSPLTPGDRIREGELLGHLFDTRTLESTRVYAPVGGYLFMLGVMHDEVEQQGRPFLHPHVPEGHTLATIAHALRL